MSEGSNRSAKADLHGKAVVTRERIEGDASIGCSNERDDAGFIRDVRVSSPQSCGLVGGSTVGWSNASFSGEKLAFGDVMTVDTRRTSSDCRRLEKCDA